MSWVPRTLDELGMVSRGRSRHRPRDAQHLYGGDYPFVQTADVKNATLYLTEYSQTYSEAGLAQSRLWEVDTLCITIAANIADTAILGIDACFPDSVIGFIADKKKADPLFVKYLFDATLQERFKQFTQGSTQDNLSLSKLLSITFMVPDTVAEQRRIADIISAYDILIENNQRRIQLLEQTVQVIHNTWFNQLQFPGHENAIITDGVPDGWVKEKLAKHIDFVRGVEPGSKSYEMALDEGLVPFLRVGDMGSRSSSIYIEKFLANGKLLQPRDIAITMDGTPGLVGLGMTGAYSTGIRKIVPRSSCKIGWCYIFALLKSQPIQATISLIANGTTILHASSSIEHLVFLLPPKNLLELYEDRTAPLLNQVLTLSEWNRNLDKARDLVAPQLMKEEVVA